MTEQEAEARRLSNAEWTVWRIAELERALAKAEQERDIEAGWRTFERERADSWQERAVAAEQERDEKATESYENGYALGLAHGNHGDHS